AIVCASVSCPDLRMQAYRAAGLSAQLDDQARLFLNTPGKGMKIGEKSIYISKIFDWFDEDFIPFGGVAAYVRKYRNDAPLTDKRLSYLDYNWSLNGAAKNVN
ncbi:MAG: hypothetical protein R8K53_06690, partial [Mariprofundaceae bacterium]